MEKSSSFITFYGYVALLFLKVPSVHEQQ